MATELNVLTPEKLNALTQKFVDLKGLTMFWENAKSYIDAADKDLSDKIDAVNITLTEENAEDQLVKLGITPDSGRDFTLSLDETALIAELDAKVDESKIVVVEGETQADAEIYSKGSIDALLGGVQDQLDTKLEGVTVVHGTGDDKITVNATIENNVATLDLTAFSTDAELAAEAKVRQESDQALQDQIDAITGAIEGGVHFIGISTTPVTDGGVEKPTIDGAEYTELSAGDIVIYQTIVDGNVESEKEFIWTGSKWAELGDTTADGKRITALEGRMDAVEAAIDAMDASFELDADAETVENEIAVVTGVNLTQENGKITAMTVDSAKAATTTYVDNAISAIEFEFATHTDIDKIFTDSGFNVTH